MQEDIERRTVAISITTAKLSGRVLAKALSAAVHKIQNEQQKSQTPHGRQSVSKLMNHGVSTNSIPLTGDTRLFDRMARKYNVDYAFHQTGANKYLLFFKSGQADAITACFSEYSKRVMAKEKRPSIKKALKHFKALASRQPKQKQRKREATRDGR